VVHGEIRADADADEVLLLVGFLWRLDDDGWAERSARLLDVVMDGLSRTPRSAS
jgi:hypothetical protein